MAEAREPGTLRRSGARSLTLLDEPEQGNGLWEEAKAKAGEDTGQVPPLTYVYNLYYRCNAWGNLPYSINNFDPIFYEEYIHGADILTSNPWVKPPDPDVENQDLSLRISDAVTEMKRVAGDTKKVILILWWWNPNAKVIDPNDADTLGDTFDKAIEAGADGVGGWNFSGSYDGEVRRLSLCTMTQQVRDLWAKICEKNESISS